MSRKIKGGLETIQNSTESKKKVCDRRVEEENELEEKDEESISHFKKEQREDEE